MNILLTASLIFIALIFIIILSNRTALILGNFTWSSKSKKMLQIIPIFIVTTSLFLFAGCSNIAQIEENDLKMETQLFVPEMKVLSEVVDQELIIKGETNLPDKTLLVISVIDHNDKETEKESFVSSGSFEIEPIPINELKSGKHTYYVKLAEDQLNSVTQIIGENGELLDGELINNNEFLLNFAVTIPKEEKKSANNKESTGKKEDTIDENSEVKKKSKPTHTSGTTEKIPVKLVKTIDGDTIKVIYDGQEHNVRYLLIDTPETSHPQLGEQPYGQEAKQRNKELVNSGDIYLEFDVGGRLDKYGRLLAYVYVGDTLVQEQLLTEGLARVAYVYPPNTRHLDRFEKAEKVARDKKIGIWSLDEYVSPKGFNSDQSSSNSSKSNSSTGNSKSSNSSNKSSHTSSDSVYYKNCTEARNAGVTPIYKGNPGYGKHLDGDGDGVACE